MSLTYPIFKTMADLTNHYYQSLSGVLAKADTFARSDGEGLGYNNTRYGGYLWANLNFEANPFAILPKIPYTKSGLRIINSAPDVTASGDNINSLGATVEGGDVADANIPTIKTIKYKPKIVQMPFGTSVVQQWLADSSQDDVAGGLESLKLFMAENLTLKIGQQVAGDAEAQAGSADATSSAEIKKVQNVESFDRIISSSAEEDAVGGTGSHWYNPWRDTNVDRDGTEEWDSYVASASGDDLNESNARLSKKLIINTKARVAKAGGGQPTVILSNQEVGAQVQQLYEQNTRYAMGEQMVQFGVNGIETNRGKSLGLTVASLYGVPFIESQLLNGNATDPSEIGRMYFLDTSSRSSIGTPRLAVAVAIPPQYNEIGAVNGTAGGVLTLGSFNNKAIFWTMMETVCSRFKGQGKIRDIGE